MTDPQLIKVYEGVPTHKDPRVYYLNVAKIIAVRDSSNDHRNVYDITTAREGEQYHVDKDSPAGTFITKWIESAIN